MTPRESIDAETRLRICEECREPLVVSLTDLWHALNVGTDFCDVQWDLREHAGHVFAVCFEAGWVHIVRCKRATAAAARKEEEVARV